MQIVSSVILRDIQYDPTKLPEYQEQLLRIQWLVQPTK